MTQEQNHRHELSESEIARLAQTIVLQQMGGMIDSMKANPIFQSLTPEQKAKALVEALSSFASDEWQERMTLMFNKD